MKADLSKQIQNLTGCGFAFLSMALGISLIDRNVDWGFAFCTPVLFVPIAMIAYRFYIQVWTGVIISAALFIGGLLATL